MPRLLVTLIFLAATSAHAAEYETPPSIVMGNGEVNYIRVENVSRDGNILTFPEVNIDSNGWLVIHPFEDGKPNGDKYVGATFLSQGMNTDVKIEVYKGLATDENFIVMLHRDSNENGIFDFVFVDDVSVMDKALFEGNRMIAHIVAAP